MVHVSMRACYIHDSACPLCSLGPHHHTSLLPEIPSHICSSPWRLLAILLLLFWNAVSLFYLSEVRTPCSCHLCSSPIAYSITRMHTHTHTHAHACMHAQTHTPSVPLFLFGIFRILESHWFVWSTQISHVPMNIDLERKRDWVSQQVHTYAYL